MHGDYRRYATTANLQKPGLFLLMWPVGWITLFGIAAIDAALERKRPLLADYPRHAAAIAIGMLLPELTSLILQPQHALPVAVDVGVCLGLVAWLVMGYSRLAAAALAAFELIGMATAIEARIGVHTLGFYASWSIVALVVIRLAAVGLIALSLRSGMQVAVDNGRADHPLRLMTEGALPS